MSATRKLHLKQHFTDAKELNLLMCQLLGCVEGKSLLEPSVGHGAFFANLIGTPRSIDIIDIDPDAIAETCSRYAHLNLTPHCDDFIDIFVEGELLTAHPILRSTFDAIISNPPYGLYLTKEYRTRIRRKFPTLYARESYGLFFAFAISRLSKNGRYVFLIPDTFLSSTHHKPLRHFIATQAAPTTIVRFASKRFESVRFGYGNLCIISGERRALGASDKIQWINAVSSNTSLSTEMLAEAQEVVGSQLCDSIDLGWSSWDLQTAASKSEWQTLGDLAECRTGIYTGDNVRFIGYDPKRVTRRLNGHPIEWSEVVIRRALTAHERLHGIDNEPSYVPLIRGGHREAFERPSSAVDWSKNAVAYYKSDKKARFQNSRFYFQPGIAVPMVSAGRISASLIEGAVFDQGVVGVFPRNPQHIAPLFLYLNSRIASRSIKTMVNGSANNSANYMKRLPVPVFNARVCDESAELLTKAKEAGHLGEGVCDEFIARTVKNLPS